MPFFRPLSKTAPGFHRDRPWPIDGLAYVAAFMGPISGGPLSGMITGHWAIAGVGLLAGIIIALAHGWLSDRFFDPWIAGNQQYLLGLMPRVVVNIVAFSWAVLLSALAMFAPFALFGSSFLINVRQ